MSVVDHLREELVARKRLAPMDLLGMPELERFDAGEFAFLGTRRYWGSMMSVGLVPADGMDLERIRACTQRFHGFTKRLEKYASELKGQKLGSMAVAMLVFESGCPPELVEPIRRIKHGSMTKDRCVAYALDARTCQVHTNRGLPMGFPGKRFLRRVLMRARGMA